jgi:arabinose-5-phosphate isomerase
MRSGKNNPVVDGEKTVSQVLVKITHARAGAASVVDKNGRLIGIFTDGDLRRHLEIDDKLSQRKIKEVMTRDPLVVKEDQLAAEALRILEERKIDEVPVVDAKNRPVGLLDVQDILRAGVI